MTATDSHIFGLITSFGDLENSLAWTQAIKYNQGRGEVFSLFGKTGKGGGVETYTSLHVPFLDG